MKYSIKKNKAIRKPLAAVILAVSVFMLLSGLFETRKVYADEPDGYWKYTDSEVHGPSSKLEGSTMSGGHGHYSCEAVCEGDYYLENHDGSCRGETASMKIEVDEPPMTTLKPGQEVTMKVSASVSASTPHDGVLGSAVKISCNMGTNEYHNSEIDFVTADGVEELGIGRTWDANDYYGYGGHLYVIGGDQTFRATVPAGREGKTLWIRHTFQHGRGEDAIETYYYYEWIDTSAATVPTSAVGGNDGKETTAETEEDDKKVDIVVDSDADANPGDQDGGFIPAGIVEGWKTAKDVAGAAGGVAAATALIALGLTDKKKKYRMAIYKDFGDTVHRGEKVYVYACIMERDEQGNEKVNHELTRQINIFSEDGVFDIYEQDELAGEYKGARVLLGRNENNREEGVVSFKFTGKGGTYTNRMKFKIDEPAIIFYQPNIALKARDEDGEEIGFTVKGLIPEKTKISLKFTGGNSYTAACSYAVTEDGTKYPGTYFAVIADINEDEGEPGTYLVHTLHVTATDGNLTVSGEIDIYRVSIGLNIGVNMLNCYRVPKKEAAGKEAKDLTDSDFDIAYTKAPAMILEYNEETKEMFYLPAKPEISFELIDPEDSLMRERLDNLGLEAKLTGINESMSEITIFCTKGYLEAPTRVSIKLVATATESIGGEEKTYRYEKEVMLLSQKKRKLPLSSAQMDTDNQQYEWVINSMCFITDNGLINDLGKEYIVLGNMWDSFDENFGFDQILVAQIQSRINDCIFRKKREALQKRQEYYEKLQETAHADNNFWTITSKSFAMASEKYVDTWGGIAARIALGVCTGGLSEIPFTAMDVNKAVSDYNERTLLCDRTTGGKLFYGSVPIIMSAVTAGVVKGVGWSVKVMTPAPIKAGLKKWAMTQSQAVMKKIPEKWVYASKNLYNKFDDFAQKINSFDPRKKMLNIRTAAAKADSLNLSAKSQVQKDILNVRKGPLSPKGEFKSTIQRAGELKAANKVDRFKKAADRVRKNPSPEAVKELKEAFMEVDKDTFALRMLNQEGKTEAQIVSKTKIKNTYRADYNKCKADFMENPAEDLMKKRAAAIKNVSEDEIVIKRASGKTAQELEEGFTVSYDSDNSPLVYDKKTGKTSYFTQAQTDEIVATSYCDATGTSYTSLDDAIQKSSDLKVVGVTPESPEYYKEFYKLKTTQAFSDDAITANIKTGRYKMAYEFGKMESSLDEIFSDKARRMKVLDECRRYINREITEVSEDTMKVIRMAEKQAECLHQAPKTYDLYIGKDINGQAYGAASGFTEESRIFVETCRMAENQGTFNIDLGELYDILQKRGTTYSKSVTNMTLCFRTINNNCGAANLKAASGFMSMVPGSGTTGATLGTSGSVGAAVSNKISERKKKLDL